MTVCGPEFRNGALALLDVFGMGEDRARACDAVAEVSHFCSRLDVGNTAR